MDFYIITIPSSQLYFKNSDTSFCWEGMFGSEKMDGKGSKYDNLPLVWEFNFWWGSKSRNLGLPAMLEAMLTPNRVIFLGNSPTNTGHIFSTF